jgi:polygalacturonase
VSTGGAVVDAKDVHGTITVEASNVTIKRTRVTSSDSYPIHFVRGKDLTIEDVEVAALQAACGPSSRPGTAPR